MEKAERGKPRHPEDDLIKILNVDDSKHKDELVENEIPEFVLHVLQGKEEKVKTDFNVTTDDQPVAPIFAAHRTQSFGLTCQAE